MSSLAYQWTKTKSVTPRLRSAKCHWHRWKRRPTVRSSRYGPKRRFNFNSHHGPCSEKCHKTKENRSKKVHKIRGKSVSHPIPGQGTLSLNQPLMIPWKRNCLRWCLRQIGNFVVVDPNKPSHGRWCLSSYAKQHSVQAVACLSAVQKYEKLCSAIL